MATLNFSSQVLADRPVLYFRFNDGHLAPEAIDSSGHGHHGQYSSIGTARLETVAATDAAVRFSGGKITVKTNPSLDPSFISMEALLIWRGPAGYQQRMLEKSSSPSGNQALYGLSVLNDGHVKVEIKSSAAFEVTSSGAIPQHQPCMSSPPTTES